jgi:hypothetical protein
MPQGYFDPYGSLQVVQMGTDGAPIAPRAPTHFKIANATAAGDTTVWTPAGGKRFRLLRLYVDASNTANIFFKDGTTQFTPQVTHTNARGAMVYDFGPAGYLSTAANNELKVNLGVAAASPGIGVLAIGWEE